MKLPLSLSHFHIHIYFHILPYYIFKLPLHCRPAIITMVSMGILWKYNSPVSKQLYRSQRKSWDLSGIAGRIETNNTGKVNAGNIQHEGNKNDVYAYSNLLH